MGLFNKHSNVTLSGEEQDKLDQIELENANARIRELEAQVANAQVEARKQKARAAGAEAKLQVLVTEALQPERERCLDLYHLASQHNAPVEVLNAAIHDGICPGDFALQLITGGGDGTG